MENSTENNAVKEEKAEGITTVNSEKSGIKDFIGTTKGKIIIGVGALVILALIGLSVFMVLKNKTYRSIMVEDVQGTANVVGEKNNGQAYKGERLYSGDDVTVLESSELTMCMNNDKYVYADENTHFKLEAASSKKSTRIKIILDEGSELNELTQKLGIDDSYEVDTPNSTMSVRGTVFRVTVFNGSDGYVYTLVEVEEGVVFIRLKPIGGDYNGTELELTAGQSALIRANEDISEFVCDGETNQVLLLKYDSLPTDGVSRLEYLIEDLTHDHIAGTWTITKEPTCEDTGIKTTTCTKCGRPMEEEISALGHDFSEWVVAGDASCEEAGEEKLVCSRCGKESGETREVEATGHNYGQWTTTKQPTCNDAGTSERVCSKCKNKETKSVPALGHDWVEVIDNEPKCFEDGHKHLECSRCHQKQEQVSTGRASHNFSTSRQLVNGYWSDPTGQDPTIYEIYQVTNTCNTCGYSETYQEKVKK